MFQCRAYKQLLRKGNSMGIRSRQYVGDAGEFRALVERSRLSPSCFANVMGTSASTVRQYLSGRREVPHVAIGAARWALLLLGIRVEISGNELARLSRGRSRLKSSGRLRTEGARQE